MYLGPINNVFIHVDVTWTKQEILIFSSGNSRLRELSEIRGRDIKNILFGWNFMAVLDYGKTFTLVIPQQWLIC